MFNLIRDGESESALKLYETEFDINKASYKDLMAVAGMYLEFFSPYKAFEYLERARLKKPNFRELSLFYSEYYFRLGKLKEAFHYQALRESAIYDTVYYGQYIKKWYGESLNGKHILLLCEQGFGDCIQYLRYAKLLKTLFKVTITIKCYKPLLDLVSSQDYVDFALENISKYSNYHYFLSLIDLPHRANISINNFIPYKNSYLDADEVQDKNLLSGSFKIGLCWSGRPRPKDRSIPIKWFEKLNELPSNVNFFSIQFDDVENEIDQISLPNLKKVGNELSEINELKNFISTLDLVVTIDTMTAHIAGSLGVPCIVVIKYFPEQRWNMCSGQISWYKSVQTLIVSKADSETAAVSIKEKVMEYLKIA